MNTNYFPYKTGLNIEKNNNNTKATNIMDVKLNMISNDWARSFKTKQDLKSIVPLHF